MLSYDIVFLSYKRPASICKAVHFASNQKVKPNNIIVWHNWPSQVKVENATNIYAEANYGCQARHAMALLLTSDVIIFVDDEVFLKSEHCSQLLLDNVELHPNTVVGYEGRILSNHKAKPYSTGTDTRNGQCSIMKGALHAVERKLLYHTFMYDTSKIKNNNLIEDDIVLSASLSMNYGSHHMAINFPSSYISRDASMLDKEALCNRTNHLSKRDEACVKMIEMGWTPYTK